MTLVAPEVAMTSCEPRGSHDAGDAVCLMTVPLPLVAFGTQGDVSPRTPHLKIFVVYRRLIYGNVTFPKNLGEFLLAILFVLVYKL